MRLHLIGLPHTQTVVEGMTVCAFTSKLVKFAEMMTDLGYEVIVYSGEHNEAKCAEHVTLFSDAQQREWYGDHDPVLLPMIATWNAEDPQWRYMNHRAIAELSQRVEKEDLILILGGLAQKPISDAFPEVISVEWAAGYSGIYLPYVCFESYAWMHHLYGRYGIGQGRFYDTVIPNFFRVDDFQPSEQQDDYLLFVGRITPDKGPHVAADIARESGRKLIMAGSGVTHHEPGRIVAGDLEILGDHVEYVGVAGVDARNELMARAHAIIVPTLYIEPFGAVAVEAQMCGTPVIATDWGAFTETVTPGVSGFRFRTLQEAVQAVDKVGLLDLPAIRQNAIMRWSLEACGPQYDRWFKRLAELWHGGWYENVTAAPLEPQPA